MDESTLFTLIDVINGAGTLSAVNAPGDPAKSVPVLPIDQASAPISWFNVADAAAGSAIATQLRCEAEVDTNYLRCAGIEQFNVCTGSIYGTQGDEVPSGCELVDVMVVEAECPAPSPAPSTSSMPMNSTMSSTSMISTATPSFSNATAISASSSMMPADTVIPLVPTSPATVGNWNLLGCANSPSGFLGWVQVASTPIMTDEYCTVSCTSYPYAGTNRAHYHCAIELEDVSTTICPDLCTLPCPGNALQASGGVVPTLPDNTTVSALANVKPQLILQALLMTTYVNLAFDATPPTNITIGDIIVNIDVIVYVDVCDSCDGGMTTCTMISPLSTTACGCSTEVLPIIPLTTVTHACESCGPSGGPSTINVTIPVDAVATRTATMPAGAVITAALGAGANAGANAGAGGNVGVVVGAGATGGAMGPIVTSALFTGEARREMGGLLGAVAVGFLALLI